MPPCAHSLRQPVVPAHQTCGRRCRGEPPHRHTTFDQFEASAVVLLDSLKFGGREYEN